MFFYRASTEFLYNGNYGDNKISVWCGPSSKNQQWGWKTKKNDFIINNKKNEVTIDDKHYSPHLWNQYFHTEQFSRDKVLSIISIEENKLRFYEVHNNLGSFVYGLRVEQVLPGGVNNRTVTKICVFSDVTFLISRDDFCVNVKGRSWIIYQNIFAKFGGFIKCVALHANLLAIGLDSGNN